VLLDYAHNPAGLRALKDMTDKMDCSVKIGIIAGVGDRREEDTQEVGAVAASMFDEIIIRQDKHLRGRTDTEIIEMLEAGIKSADPNKKVTIIAKERDAIIHAVKTAPKNALIVVCSDVIPDALNLVAELKEEESNRLYKFNPEEDIPNKA
jgi:cyanophycin synthetase